jgi:hypothetical protein
MKTFSDEALAALQRGDAIVSASVEIIPSSAISYSTVGIYDIDSVSDASTTKAGGLLVGTTISGFSAADVARFSLPTGQTNVAWNYDDTTPPGLHFTNSFDVILDGDSTSSVRLSDLGVGPSSSAHSVFFSTAEAARAAFGVQTLTGASTYHLYINDSPITDNSGGLSIRVERGSATIELSIEGAARGLVRRGGRIRSDADQRLVSSTDGFYRVVSAAPKKTLYWGGKRPSVAGSAVGGGGGTSSSGTSPSSF